MENIIKSMILLAMILYPLGYDLKLNATVRRHYQRQLEYLGHLI